MLEEVRDKEIMIGLENTWIPAQIQSIDRIQRQIDTAGFNETTVGVQ